ncbi:hypothetical protein DFH09DRAFT_1103130 [Mycena vulgaris]|nr:hypothetical protein DFH09DRAFT_1103130 [Mycena vulgaris]
MPPYAQTSAAQKTKGYCISDPPLSSRTLVSIRPHITSWCSLGRTSRRSRSELQSAKSALLLEVNLNTRTNFTLLMAGFGFSSGPGSSLSPHGARARCTSTREQTGRRAGPQRRPTGGSPESCCCPVPSDGVKGLNVMFSSIPLSSSKSGILIKRMLRFNHAHTIYDTNFRPPTFRRDEPSYSAPRDPIPITLKRKADDNIDEKRPEKCLKKGKVADKNTKAEQRLGSQTNQRRKLRSGKSLL